MHLRSQVTLRVPLFAETESQAVSIRLAEIETGGKLRMTLHVVAFTAERHPLLPPSPAAVAAVTRSGEYG